ncbi:MAG: hypothetical protein KJZ75_09215 [Hyphomonadaceae bacterium]|nr:hypothetical protein [Hyphomonadaceae bacterium]GIK47917.1 MAG: hypothetical protein BroJett013_06140 [Alphaproteobacteria bacterium]
MAILNAAAALVALMFAQATAPEMAEGVDLDSDEIVVTAPAAEEVRAFVEALSAESSTGQLARWDRLICPAMMGAPVDVAQLIIDRIAVRAIEVDLDVGGPDCRPNIFIVVSNDSDALAESLRDTRFISYYGQHGNTRGRAAYRNFSNTSRAVRWWHVTRSVGADGEAIGGDSNDGPRTLRTTYAGRLRATTREDFSHVIVIVDAPRVASIRLGALADYIAMVALAQIDPESDVSDQPSILNLFAERAEGREGPDSLTEWDRTYLAGLYRAPRDARSSRQQQREIERRMRREP